MLINLPTADEYSTWDKAQFAKGSDDLVCYTSPDRTMVVYVTPTLGTWLIHRDAPRQRHYY